jgi:hypothetical protein
MRARLSLAMVAGLLLCALAATEFPELLNLVDNTSNDYSLIVVGRSGSSPAAVPRATVRATWRLVAAPVVPASPMDINSISSQASIHFSHDLLPILCIRRT